MYARVARCQDLNGRVERDGAGRGQGVEPRPSSDNVMYALFGLGPWWPNGPHGLNPAPA